MGLNDWASTLVRGADILLYTEEIVRVYSDGRREPAESRPVLGSTVKEEESGEHYAGMFDDEYSLSKYTFPDGRVLYERVQATPWSSGPVFFLALQDEKGRWVPESLWSQDAIDHA